MKQPLLVSIALVFLLSYAYLTKGAQAGIVEEFSFRFCLKQPNLTKCPTLPTFDLIDITAMGGKWYEIGSTARFKLTQEAGAACSQTNYTVVQPPGTFWYSKVANLTFVDKGIKAIGNIAQFGVQQIAGAAKELCQSTRDICRLLSTGSQIDQALSLISNCAGSIFLSHGPESSLLSSTRINIGTAITAINIALGSLTRNVTQIQFLNSQISQGNGTAKENVAKLLDLTKKTGTVQDDIQGAVKSLEEARGKIIQVAGKLMVARVGTVPLNTIPELVRAAFLVATAENAILSLAAGVRFATFGLSAMTGLIGLDNSKPGGFITAPPGLAVQDPLYHGRLEATMGLVKEPYLILAVDGFPNVGYNAALVYSCSEVPGTHYKQAMFIISRTPVLSDRVIERFMSIASFHGILNECDDPFLFTVQNVPMCLV